MTTVETFHVLRLIPLIVRKRLILQDLDMELYDKQLIKHECLPYKQQNASYCFLRQQYSPEKSHYSGYSGGCSCELGLTCTPTNETTLVVPRFGKCTPSN